MSFKTAVSKIANFLIDGETEEKKEYTPAINLTKDGNKYHSDYYGGGDIRSHVLIRDDNGYTKLENDLYKRRKGYNLSPGEKAAKSEYARLAQEKYNEEGRETSDEAVTDRSTFDRILGLLGYNGIAQGLYYLTDDDEETTLGQGLREGLTYMNPFTDDVTNRKSMSDVLKNIGWEDEDPDKLSLSDVGRGIVGFAGDVLTDPLSYINPFGAAGKVVKGSGYTLDTVKAIEKLDPAITKMGQIKGVTKVADYLHDSGLTNIEKLQKVDFLKLDTIKDMMKEHIAYQSLSPAEFADEAEKLFEGMNRSFYHINFSKATDEGFSIGLHHLPFMEKKAQALKKTIVSNEQLTKLGDKTISPYYNTLASKLRTSRIGKNFTFGGIERQFAKGEMTSAQAQAAYIYRELKRGVQKAKIDADDIAFARTIADKNFTEEELYEMSHFVESDGLKKADMHDEIRTRISEKAVDTKTGEMFLDEDEVSKRIFSKEASGELKNTVKKLDDAVDERVNLRHQRSIEEHNNYEAKKALRSILNDYIYNRNDMTAERNLYYGIKNSLPSLASDDQGIIDVYEIAKNSLDTDIIKTLYNYQVNGKGNKVFGKLLERIIDGEPSVVENFINTRIGTMSSDELLDMFKNYGVKYGDESVLDDIVTLKASSNPKHLEQAWFKAVDDSYSPVHAPSFYFDMEGVLKLVEECPDGADLGEYLLKVLDDHPQTKMDMLKYAGLEGKIPEIDNIFTNYQKNFTKRQNLVNELEAKAKSKYGIIEYNNETFQEFLDKVNNATANVVNRTRDIEDFFTSRDFSAYKEIEKFMNPYSNESKLFDSLENIYDDIKHIDNLDEKIAELADANAFKTDEPEKFELLKAFQKRMSEIAKEQVERGLLKQEQVDKYSGKYIEHVLTDEGKKLYGVTDPIFEQTGAFKGITGKSGSSSHSRTVEGTIKELNEQYGKKIYETALSDIYLTSVLRANHNIYSEDSVNFLKKHFTEKLDRLDPSVPWSKLVEDDEVVGVAYNDLNKAVNNEIKSIMEDRSTDIINDMYDARCEELSQLPDFDDSPSNRKKIYDDVKREFNETMYADMRKAVQEEVYNDLFGSNEAAKELFAPNIPLQQLDDKVANIVYEKYGISPLKIHKSILDTANTVSKTQKMHLQSDLLNIYDKFLNVWKLNNTLTAPSFHVQNAASNAFQSFLGISEDALNPKKIKRAWSVLKLKDPKQTIKFAAGEFSYEQLEHIAKTTGVVDEGFISADMGEGAKSIYEKTLRKSALPTFKDVDWATPNLNPLNTETNTLYQASTVVGTNIESVQRMNHFLSCLDQGMSIEDAVRSVNQYLFDYSELTTFEQNVMKRVIPFYTFMRKNLPLQLESMLNRPQVYKTLERAIDNVQKMNGNYVDENYRNEWRQDYIQLPFDVNGQSYGVNLQLPYQQLDRLEPDTALQKLIGSTTPLIKTPIELAAGKTAYTGIDISDNMTDYIISQLGVLPSAAYRTGKALSEGDTDTTLTNITKTLAFPIAKIENYAKPADLTEEEYNKIFEEVYGFSPY